MFPYVVTSDLRSLQEQCIFVLRMMLYGCIIFNSHVKVPSQELSDAMVEAFKAGQETDEGGY